jgi:hypothetical protein
MARTMGEEASLPPSLWMEAINTATYLKNRLPYSHLPLSQTPHEVLHGTKPKISHLKPYGQICYAHIPEEKRKAGSKLQPRVIKTHVVGYTSQNIYRLYDPNTQRISTARDVIFPPYISSPTLDQPQGIIDNNPAETPLEDNNSTILTENPERPLVSVKGNTNTSDFPSHEHRLRWMQRNPEQATEWMQQRHPKILEVFDYFNNRNDPRISDPDFLQ